MKKTEISYEINEQGALSIKKGPNEELREMFIACIKKSQLELINLLDEHIKWMDEKTIEMFHNKF